MRHANFDGKGDMNKTMLRTTEIIDRTFFVGEGISGSLIFSIILTIQKKCSANQSHMFRR